MFLDRTSRFEAVNDFVAMSISGLTVSDIHEYEVPEHGVACGQFLC